jgi:hypothetical protein
MKFNPKNLTITNSYANYEVLENDVTTNIEVTWSFRTYNQMFNTVKIDLDIDEAVQYDDDVSVNIKLTKDEKRSLFSMIEDEVEQDATEYGLLEWLDQNERIEYEREEW